MTVKSLSGYVSQAWEIILDARDWCLYSAGVRLPTNAWELAGIQRYIMHLPWSSSVTSANAIPTSVINSQVVLILRLIWNAERVYEENILGKTSLSIKVNSLFLHKTTALVQNLPKATQQSPFYQEKIEPMGFFPSLAFIFTLHTSTKPTDASASKIIALKMQPSKKIWKPMKYVRGHIKSNIQLLILLSKSH